MDKNPVPLLQPIYALQRQAEQCGYCRVVSLTSLPYRNRQWLPLLAFEFGGSTRGLPVMTLIGGIHGIERIGVDVCLAFTASLLQRLRWDVTLDNLLQQVRLQVIPLANPVGYCGGSRANGEGIDLMRNAPVTADGPVPLLVGGHRLSHHLPWYRGPMPGRIATEARCLLDYLRLQQQDSPFQLVLDCHSGFGIRDYLWFPFAGSRRPYPWLAQLTSLVELFEASHPHHQHYHISPQHHHYMTHGDLWDYHCRDYRQAAPLVILTLEMGSWLWIKKNPRQLFSYAGLFNPFPPHRHQRVLRRHQQLIEFLLHATAAYRRWQPAPGDAQARYQAGIRRWYPQEGSRP